MKPKFEIGDRVRYNELEAVVVGIDAESKRYSIQYEDDDDKYCVKEDWIEFANPLAQRLTAEEKERVRKEYTNTYPLDPDCGVANILIQGVLERIFGKEFFKEDKE